MYVNTVPKYTNLGYAWSLGACMYELKVCDSLVQSCDAEEEADPQPKWDQVKVNNPAFLATCKSCW